MSVWSHVQRHTWLWRRVVCGPAKLELTQIPLARCRRRARRAPTFHRCSAPKRTAPLLWSTDLDTLHRPLSFRHCFTTSVSLLITGFLYKAQVARMPRRVPASATRGRASSNVSFADVPPTGIHADNLSLLRRQWKWANFSQFFFTFSQLLATPDITLTVSHDRVCIAFYMAHILFVPLGHRRRPFAWNSLVYTSRYASLALYPNAG